MKIDGDVVVGGPRALLSQLLFQWQRHVRHAARNMLRRRGAHSSWRSRAVSSILESAAAATGQETLVVYGVQ